MKYEEIYEVLRPYVDFACLLCMEKKKTNTKNTSPCAIRKILGEVCTEIEKVVQIVENEVTEQIAETIQLKPSDYDSHNVPANPFIMYRWKVSDKRVVRKVQEKKE